MSDLRTEIFTKVLPKMQTLTKPTDLSKLNFDDPEQPLVPVSLAEPKKLSNNERIWNYVRDNPKATARQVANAISGVPESSVWSQLSSMVRLGRMTAVRTRVGLLYTVLGDRYPALTSEERVDRMREARKRLGPEEISRRVKEGWAKKTKKDAAVTPTAPAKVKEAPVAVAAPAVQVTPVDLNTLSIVQARKLYDELKQIFGA